MLSQCRWDFPIPPYSFGITLGDSSIDVPNNYTIINTNDLSGSGDDSYGVSSGSGSFNIGGWSAALQLFFRDGTGTFISNPQDLFIEPPDLTNLSLSQMGIVRILNGCSGCDGTVFGTVTSIVAIPKTVAIDIKPGSDPNSINPRSKGVIPVAILSTNTAEDDAPDFDATQVDALTVEFGPYGAVESHGQGHVEDVDGDGDPDMVFHFNTRETGIVCGDADATLTGESDAGDTLFTGTDTVKTVGCNGSKQDTIISTKGAGAMSWIFLVGLSVLGLWRQKG
jgi:hypothetical protein